ncbi:hypothetical protein ACHQM5_007195 [Ranunculus cassubicifolius]
MAEETLWRLRLQVIDVLKDWDTKPYQVKKWVFRPYLHRLFITRPQIHKDRNDVLADLEVLKDLLAALKPDIAQGQTNYIQFQIAVIYAHKRLGMLLQEVDRKLREGIIIPVPDSDFQKWIHQELSNADWEGSLEFVNEAEPLVLRKAKAKGVQIKEQTITQKDIDVVNPDDIRNRLKMYREDLEKAHEMPKDNVDCIAHGPSACQFIEEIITKLSDRCVDLPDDNKLAEYDWMEQCGVELAEHDWMEQCRIEEQWQAAHVCKS